MATPFSFFRKYAGGLMVVMVILSMMLFTMDSIFSDTSANLWLLGMLIGAAAFGIAGIGSGRWVQWGIGGAVMGTVLGLVLPSLATGGGITSTVGTFTPEKLNDLAARRTIANQFMGQVDQFARFKGPEFTYGQPTTDMELIFGYLMQEEAKRLGIGIDEAAIAEYLEQVAGEDLTKQKYLEARNSMSYQGKPLDEETFRQILGDEIKGKLAYVMLQPRPASTPPAPDTYWQYFRRLQVRQQIEVASLDVGQFLDKVKEPTDADIENLFEEYKNYYPNNKEPGAPGFALPTRANLAYIELDAKAVEASLDPVSDDDIKKYYEENKESPLIRSIVIPDEEEKPESPEEATKDDANGEKESEAKDTDASDAKESEAAEGTPKPDTAAEEKENKEATDQPADSGEKKAAVPEEAKPAEPEKSTAKETAPKKAQSKTDATEKPATEGKVEEAASEEATEAETKSKEQTAKKPVFNQEEADKDTSSESQDKSEASAEQTSEEDAAAAKDGDQKNADVLTIPDAPEEAKADEPEYEYRELDDELSEQIRELIMADRVSEEMETRIKKAKGEMELIARRYSQKRMEMLTGDTVKYDPASNNYQEALKDLREELSGFYDELNTELKELGAKYDFAFVETGLLGAQELQSSEDLTIATATEPVDNPMMQFQAPSVVSVVFPGLSMDEQQNAGQMFIVREAAKAASGEDGSARRMLYWVSNVSPQHVPELDEPGVREAVVEAWKSIEARELVQKRGEELAKKVEAALKKEGDEKQNLVDALKGETVTGDEDGVPLALRVSAPFSWMRVSQAPQMSFQQRPQAELSMITFDAGKPLEMVGTKFMKTIFDEMDDEDVQVVPNFDLSTFHVVHVTNRFPTKEVGEDGLRENFAKESQQNGFRNSPLLPVMSRELNAPASRQWQQSIWDKYEVSLFDEE